MKEELKKLFFHYLDSSVKVTSDKYPESIFYVYDKQIIRDRSINTLLNIEYVSNEYTFKDIKDSIIFEQDRKNGYLYIKHDMIWSVFSSKLSMDHQQTKALFKDLLGEHDKLKELTPKLAYYQIFTGLGEHDKLKELTPKYSTICSSLDLGEHDKLKELTPGNHLYLHNLSLEEHDKLKALTPESAFNKSPSPLGTINRV